MRQSAQRGRRWHTTHMLFCCFVEAFCCAHPLAQAVSFARPSRVMSNEAQMAAAAVSRPNAHKTRPSRPRKDQNATLSGRRGEGALEAAAHGHLHAPDTPYNLNRDAPHCYRTNPLPSATQWRATQEPRKLRSPLKRKKLSSLATLSSQSDQPNATRNALHAH